MTSAPTPKKRYRVAAQPESFDPDAVLPRIQHLLDTGTVIALHT